jgi:hypothetical protein
MLREAYQALHHAFFNPIQLGFGDKVKRQKVNDSSKREFSGNPFKPSSNGASASLMSRGKVSCALRTQEIAGS